VTKTLYVNLSVLSLSLDYFNQLSSPNGKLTSAVFLLLMTK